MSKVITPTVGRKVWYRPAAHDIAGRFGMQVAGTQDDPQPLDATVTAVWSDCMVNLLVLDAYGKPFPLTSVTLAQEGDDLPMQGKPNADGHATPGGYAQWMPYQQTQAAKAEGSDSTTAQVMSNRRRLIAVCSLVAVGGAALLFNKTSMNRNCAFHAPGVLGSACSTRPWQFNPCAVAMSVAGWTGFNQEGGLKRANLFVWSGRRQRYTPVSFGVPQSAFLSHSSSLNSIAC
jgi:hypothetical protein